MPGVALERFRTSIFARAVGTLEPYLRLHYARDTGTILLAPRGRIHLREDIRNVATSANYQTKFYPRDFRKWGIISIVQTLPLITFYLLHFLAFASSPFIARSLPSPLLPRGEQSSVHRSS